MSAPGAGVWGRPVKIFHEIYGNGGIILGTLGTPVALADARGDVLLALDTPYGGMDIVTHRAGARSSRVRILTAPGYPGSFTVGAMDSAGDAVLAWMDFAGAPRAAYINRRWQIGRPQLLGHGEPNLPLSITMNETGTAIVTWSDEGFVHPGYIYAADAGRSGRFSVTPLSRPIANYGVASPSAGINDRGHAAATWAVVPAQTGPPAFLLMAHGSL